MRLAEAPPNPWFSWEYVERNAQDIARYLEQHASLTFQAVVIAFVLALPLAALAHLRPRLAGPVLGVAGVLYTVPSLALFAILAPYTGIGRTTVLIGLVSYALLVLTRNVLVGLQGVDPAVRDAARGMGYGRARMLFAVELPQALPSIVAGLRLATVTTVALVTVGVVVGYGGLGPADVPRLPQQLPRGDHDGDGALPPARAGVRPGARGHRPTADAVGARREAGVTWTS